MKQIKRSVVQTVLCLSAFIMFADVARGCGCYPFTTVLDDYEGSDLVIVARFVSVTKTSTPRWPGTDIDTATMIVEKVYKGDGRPATEVSIYFQPQKKEEDKHAEVRRSPDQKGRFSFTVLGEVKGGVFSSFRPNDRDFVTCSSIKEFIGKAGSPIVVFETPHVDVDGTKDVTGLVLQYPITPCTSH